MSDLPLYLQLAGIQERFESHPNRTAVDPYGAPLPLVAVTHGVGREASTVMQPDPALYANLSTAAADVRGSQDGNRWRNDPGNAAIVETLTSTPADQANPDATVYALRTDLLPIADTPGTPVSLAPYDPSALPTVTLPASIANDTSAARIAPLETYPADFVGPVYSPAPAATVAPLETYPADFVGPVYSPAPVTAAPAPQTFPDRVELRPGSVAPITYPPTNPIYAQIPSLNPPAETAPSGRGILALIALAALFSQ
jgi:hypothetical protein